MGNNCPENCQNCLADLIEEGNEEETYEEDFIDDEEDEELFDKDYFGGTLDDTILGA